ncbi:unnamed protein product, partial [Nesidiocoris tenuis]
MDPPKTRSPMCIRAQAPLEHFYMICKGQFHQQRKPQSANGAGAPVNSCSALEHMPAFNNKLRKKEDFVTLSKSNRFWFQLITEESHASHTTGSSRTKDSPATSNSQK